MSRLFSWFKITLITFICLASITNTSSAQNNWRKDIGIFRIGIITSSRSVEALDRLEPFKIAISEALDMQVEFFRAQNATSLINALGDERIEYAIFSASSYALAWTSCQCIEPIVTPRSKDSTDGFHTVVIAAPDGPKSLENLSSKIGILSKESITGSALVTHELNKKNILIGNETPLFIFKDSAETTLQAFAQGEIKTLIGWSSLTGNPSDGYSRGSLRQLVEKHGANARDYKVLWKSDQIPHRPHVMRKKLSEEAKSILRNTLLEMFQKKPVAYDAIEPIYGGGFTRSHHQRFEQLISLMEAQNVQTKTAEESPPLQ